MLASGNESFRYHTRGKSCKGKVFVYIRILWCASTRHQTKAGHLLSSTNRFGPAATRFYPKSYSSVSRRTVLEIRLWKIESSSCCTHVYILILFVSLSSITEISTISLTHKTPETQFVDAILSFSGNVDAIWQKFSIEYYNVTLCIGDSCYTISIVKDLRFSEITFFGLSSKSIYIGIRL